MNETLTHARFLVKNIRIQLDEYSATDYPDRGADVVIALMHGVVEYFERELNADDLNQHNVRNVCQVMQFLGGWLEYLDNAGTHQTPRGTSCLLAYLTRQLGEDCEIMAWPQSDYNYTIRDLQKIVSKLFYSRSLPSELQRQCRKPIKLVSFPRLERDNFLMNTVFGHEFGHPIADEVVRDYSSSDEFTERLHDIRREVDKHTASQLADLGVTVTHRHKIEIKLQQNTCKEILDAWRRALEELLSDCVAVALFGPAALFSSHNILMIGGWDQVPTAPDWYPPSRMRIRVALRTAERLGFFPESPSDNRNVPVSVIYEQLQKYKSLVESDTDQRALNSTFELKLAYGFVSRCLDQAT